jgi:hypothetical protein
MIHAVLALLLLCVCPAAAWLNYSDTGEATLTHYTMAENFIASSVSRIRFDPKKANYRTDVVAQRTRHTSPQQVSILIVPSCTFVNYDVGSHERESIWLVGLLRPL